MSEARNVPDSTAVRVALWRALHVLIDAPPHVLEDEIGLKLIEPAGGWQSRPDMHPMGTSRYRASIVARARFIEDLIDDEVKKGTSQYVILGAGLDTLAQRKPELGKKLKIYEVDQPETQAWKFSRLKVLGFEVHDWLRFVPMNFEKNESLWNALGSHGFDKSKPAIISSLGVSMYLTRDAIRESLSEMSKLAPGSKFVMTFMLPLELLDREDQPGFERVLKGAQASGTPFISLFAPDEMLTLARQTGFKHLEHVSVASLAPKYFSNRTDGLRPSSGEELLIATV